MTSTLITSRRWLAALAVLALVAALAPAATAGSGPERLEPDRPAPSERDDAPDPGGVAEGLWFVELPAEPQARGGQPSEHANERAQLLAEARQEGLDFSQRADFSTLWNGLSVEADTNDAAILRALDTVAAVYPVAEIELPEPTGTEPDLASALGMTGADAAQSELGLTGEGLSVAIVDTGIDYNHPDLGGGGDTAHTIEAAGPDDRELDHPRITHGWDYVGEEFNPADPDAPQDPDPNPNPMDVQGHGTHVAGIVGAEAADEDGVTGVAPEVTFGAYKVFGPGSTTADVIVDALEDAYLDGMDIVNMSLGATFVWGQEYPTTATSNELAAQGVTVVNSAGNDGALGTWALSAPANAHDIISVASADNLELIANVFEVDQLDDPIPWLEMTGAEEPPTEGESDPLALPAFAEFEDSEGFLGCEAENFDDFPGDHVALIERGECPFADKYVNAANAGASAVVIFNNVPGLFAGTIQDAGIEGIWSAGISDEDGQTLAGLLEAGQEVTLEFTDEMVSAPSPTGGLVSSFSSYGQDVELEFGPSVMAPGGLITSTYPLEQGAYAMLSGTSMSAPHVAGAVALLLEDRPDLDPLEVRDRLQNTGEPAVWSLNPDLGLLDHTFRQGAGMIQIDRAVETEQHVVPGQIAVGDGTEPFETTITVANDGQEPVEYDLGFEAALETALDTYLVGQGFFLVTGSENSPDSGVSFDAGSVTVEPGASADVDVTITPPAVGLPNHQYGGYITLTASDGDVLRVPYSGYAGDYQSLPLLGAIGPDGQFVEQEPFLAEITGEDEDGIPITEPVEDGHEFTVRDGDYPVIEAFFGHYPQRMEVYAVNQASGGERLVFQDEHLPRSPGPNDFLTFVWPGTTQAGRSDNVRSVPSGTYTLEVKVLRALGDPDNADHWESWESPEFELDTRRGGPAAGAPGDRGPQNGRSAGGR